MSLGILPTTLCEKMKRLGIRPRVRDLEPGLAEVLSASASEM